MKKMMIKKMFNGAILNDLLKLSKFFLKLLYMIFLKVTQQTITDHFGNCIT